MNTDYSPQRYLGYTWEQITTRLKGRHRQQALALWKWSAIRYSDTLCPDQIRHTLRYGFASTVARINRVRVWAGLPEV